MSDLRYQDANTQETELDFSTDQVVVPLDHGNRKFYDIDHAKPESEPAVEELKVNFPLSSQQASSSSRLQSTDSDKQDLLKYICDNIMGNNKVFVGPFGRRKVEYCDYTASGRSLTFIEDYIYQNVLSDYGNTHTMTSVSSLQTTLFRHEARDIIRNSVNASEHDCVLFESSGATGAIQKLIHVLDLPNPPLVIVSPFEHHSNLLPWREMGLKVIRVQETRNGELDIFHLETILKHAAQDVNQIICAFAAASNITGTLVDVNAVTAMCHKYEALVLWDYATAAPYVEINMNPVISGVNPELVAKDAIFISTHKFVGGVQTPGILIAKKKLFRKKVPFIPGGGTVFFVRRDAQRYIQEVELREEGGTPAIVESIRAGLVFQLKEAVGTGVIMAREEQLVRKAIEHWKGCPSLLLLGSKQAPRLAVFSFMVQHPQMGLYLHHNYVCALLNDMFGIQARGGCACAGPYAEDLLGIDEELAKRYEDLLLEDRQLDRTHLRRHGEYSHHEILRPGFVRLNLPYFMDDDTISFILESVKLVAEHGWKLLPQYNFNPETGEWRHRYYQIFRDRTWLGHVTYKSGSMMYKLPNKAEWIDKTKEPPTGHEDCLKQGKDIFEKADKVQGNLPDQDTIFNEESNRLRWFSLPSEALLCLRGCTDLITPKVLPFQVVSYPREVTTKKVVVNCSIQDIHKQKLLADQKRNEGCSEICTGLKTFQESFSSFLEEGCKKMDTKRSNLHCDELAADQIKAEEILNQKPQLVLKGHEGGATSCKSGNYCIMQDVEGEELSMEKQMQTVDFTTLCKDTSMEEVAASSKTSEDTNKLNAICQRKKHAGGHKWHSPPKTIFKPFLQAIEEFSMIKDGDRVLLCLSGGKDSLSLLHSLHQYQFYSKSQGINFELGAVTIDPKASSYDPSPLKNYLSELRVPYYYEEQCILDTAQNLPYECASICSFCSRMKRGRIYHTARQEKYNVLALGQHLDDLAESFLMSVFYNGNLRTMKACYNVEEGDLRVIRPFVYVREVDLRRFAEENALPVIAENCPACFQAPKERHRMKQLLAAQEILHPHLFSSILTAMKPILSIDRTGINIKGLINDQHGSIKEDNFEMDQI